MASYVLRTLLFSSHVDHHQSHQKLISHTRREAVLLCGNDSASTVDDHLDSKFASPNIQSAQGFQ